MLRNNADARRYSYFELGLPVEQLTSTKLSIILRSERLGLKRSVILLRQLYRGSSRKRTPSGNEKNVRNWSCRQLTRVSVRKASTEFVNSKHKYLSIVNLH